VPTCDFWLAVCWAYGVFKGKTSITGIRSEFTILDISRTADVLSLNVGDEGAKFLSFPI
jgi:hypothetical protein